MRLPRSLQARLAVSLGILLTLVWIAAASVTAVILRGEMDEVFDSALMETAQRILPLAVVDIVGRDEDGVTQHLSTLRAHEEFFTYVVRDGQGRILLQSHAADPGLFPAYDGPGFRQTATHRFYNDDALQGSIRITVAEPLTHRAEVAQEIQMGLGLPLFFVIPITLLAIVLAVRASLASLRQFREKLEARSASDLSPVSAKNIPLEMVPVAATLNSLLSGLSATFEAERSFAANAAHELRTPLAGAIAQAQRLQSETTDPAARIRAADIESTLKRLTRLSERLMQLARAEGARLRLDQPSDLRPVTQIIVDEMEHSLEPGRIILTMPDLPVRSDLDPDVFGILCQNLLDNALRHGMDGATVTVTMTETGTLTVSNDGPVVPAKALDRLTDRFARAGGRRDGSGLGLAIVAAIAGRVGGKLILCSPRPDSTSGFEATVSFPVRSGKNEP